MTKAFLDRKVDLMTQIVFANIVEICFIMTYVVLTVTCRHEFNDVKCYTAIWFGILSYFLYYVRSGYAFVLEFQQLVHDCEPYLAAESQYSQQDKQPPAQKEDGNQSASQESNEV